jgi:hypothetical protein
MRQPNGWVRTRTKKPPVFTALLSVENQAATSKLEWQGTSLRFLTVWFISTTDIREKPLRARLIARLCVICAFLNGHIDQAGLIVPLAASKTRPRPQKTDSNHSPKMKERHFQAQRSQRGLP